MLKPLFWTTLVFTMVAAVFGAAPIFGEWIGSRLDARARHDQPVDS